MQTRNLFAIATLTIALTSTVFGQGNPDKPGNKVHDKYANQEVSYRQAKNEVAIESLEKSKDRKTQAAVFEPNNEPLWAKQNKRWNQVRNRPKNQDIEVENDETHRTQPRAAQTETVNNNESLRTKGRQPGRKN